jgi:hypothetical protein
MKFIKNMFLSLMLTFSLIYHPIARSGELLLAIIETIITDYADSIEGGLTTGPDGTNISIWDPSNPGSDFADYAAWQAANEPNQSQGVSSATTLDTSGTSNTINTINTDTTDAADVSYNHGFNSRKEGHGNKINNTNTP